MSNPKFIPAFDYLLVKRVDAEETTPGGIVIPGLAKEKPFEGTVIAVGPGRVLEDGSRRQTDARIGYRIMFGRHSTYEIKIDGEEYVLIKDSDIFGTICK